MGKDIKQLTIDMHQFVSAKGWYQPDSKRPQTPKNIAISLVLEASEVLEHFQWHENDLTKKQLEGEVADVALYLFQLCQICKIDLEDAIDQKLKQNYKREWDQNTVK
ncbi:MAG: nucleotide pyrophosphohydrolase [Anaerolineaceae bacterium]|jgi:NTP pyrophosphatase (non-canonical NTP hydrolase)|nr:nucleotide pyrophosphohydrolase [Anaerolineaceae bacterium]